MVISCSINLHFADKERAYRKQNTYFPDSDIINA
ncbi:unnamed protein product [Callosobruchus maculatus]|uniref:Uncharacterized protein n=1 Tax=Callosobruchus maculatus TaxID=64391 RepID=A0A653BEL3_CALMS|nr:unnamed protein product [Callosobruchus maculatus]